MLLLLLACIAPKVSDSPSVVVPDSPADSPADSPSDSVPDTDSTDSSPTNVLWLVVDGIRVEEITSSSISPLTGVSGEANCPNFWATMGAEGTMVRAIHNMGITETGPAHVAFFTGRPEPYGNLSLDQSIPSLYYPESPTLWSVAKNAGILSSFWGNAGLLYDVTQSLYPDAYLLENYQHPIGTTDRDVLRSILSDISENHPRLIVANLHNVDAEGHLGLAGTYADTIQTIDKDLSEFWGDLGTEEPDWRRHTLVVVTGDHGRHREDPESEVPWKTHGDSCAGCREVPLLLLGPGIPAGQVIERSWTSADLSSMVAAWLGLDLPFAEGLPLDDVVTGLNTPLRQGEMEVQSVGGHRLVQRLESQEDHRSSIWMDGEELSGPDVLAAASPQMAIEGDQRWVCWRELRDLGLTLPWVPRCMTRTGDEPWVDIGFPSEDVQSSWEISMVAKDGGLWVGWTSEIASISHWQDGSWTTYREIPSLFPVHPSLAVSGTNVEMSWSDGERQGRDIKFLAGDGFRNMKFGTGLYRAERSALRLDGQNVQVAALLYQEDLRTLALVSSPDMGETLLPPEWLPSPDPFLPNVSPQWVGSRLYWAVQLSDKNAGICEITPGESQPSCVSAGFPYLDSFAVDGTEVLASVRTDPGIWEILTLQLP
jgi:hypothetical protein